MLTFTPRRGERGKRRVCTWSYVGEEVGGTNTKKRWTNGGKRRLLWKSKSKKRSTIGNIRGRKWKRGRKEAKSHRKFRGIGVTIQAHRLERSKDTEVEISSKKTKEF